ncbi:uncharacterized protein LOC105170830 [Sesamum indicum]|uniref:Uncharacterized protein LOC105170830 n=1 Tax=Sesamum indicum TaxID=4182 RepID=A0A6I9TTH4_SESIN|nr:uncharacterized protein LOC105170830 [Sesamum indicum]
MASNYVNGSPFPARYTFAILHKWPESDAEFIQSMTSGDVGKGDAQPCRVMEWFACRQLYLRSYVFSREEDSAVVKCFGRVKDKVVAEKRKRKCGVDGGRKSGGLVFRWLLSCTSKIDVID